MNTKDFIVNNGSESQVVKDVSAVSPNIDTSIFPQTLIIKAINLCNLAALVISTDESYPLGVAHFESEEEEEGLHGVEPSINKISHEQIVGNWTFSANFQQLH